MLHLFVAGWELGPDWRGIWLGDTGRIVQGHQFDISNSRSILVEVKGQSKLQVVNTPINESTKSNSVDSMSAVAWAATPTVLPFSAYCPIPTSRPLACVWKLRLLVATMQSNESVLCGCAQVHIKQVVFMSAIPWHH